MYNNSKIDMKQLEKNFVAMKNEVLKEMDLKKKNFTKKSK